MGVKWPTKCFGPLGPLGFYFYKHSPTTPPKRTAGNAFLLSDRVELSSAGARVEEIKGGSVGVLESFQKDRARTHTESKSAFVRLMVSHGWSIKSPVTDTP